MSEQSLLFDVPKVKRTNQPDPLSDYCAEIGIMTQYARWMPHADRWAAVYVGDHKPKGDNANERFLNACEYNAMQVAATKREAIELARVAQSESFHKPDFVEWCVSRGIVVMK